MRSVLRHVSSARISVNVYLVLMVTCRIQLHLVLNVTISALNARGMRIGQSLVIHAFQGHFLLAHNASCVPSSSIGVILLIYAQDAPFLGV